MQAVDGQTTKSSDVRRDASLLSESKPAVALGACSCSIEHRDRIAALEGEVVDLKKMIRKANLKLHGLEQDQSETEGVARKALRMAELGEVRVDAFVAGQQSMMQPSKRRRTESVQSCDDVGSEKSEGNASQSESGSDQQNAQSADEEEAQSAEESAEPDDDVEMDSLDPGSPAKAAVEQLADVAVQPKVGPLKSRYRVKSVARRPLNMRPRDSKKGPDTA